jgi:hypothetical protein
VTAAAGPEPSIQAVSFAPAVGEHSSAGLGAVRADQIQMPASGGPTVQLGLCCWPVPSGLSLSGVHGCGRFSPWKSTVPAPASSCFRMKDRASKLERSRDIDPTTPKEADTLLSNAMDNLLFYRTTLNLRFFLHRALQPSPAVLAALLRQRNAVQLQ